MNIYHERKRALPLIWRPVLMKLGFCSDFRRYWINPNHQSPFLEFGHVGLVQSNYEEMEEMRYP